jgi:glutamate/tyrosine decarboxylase-like PLP-dependent enzyme
MPLDSTDMNKLIRAINRNTAAQLAAAAIAGQHGKASVDPTGALKAAVSSTFDEFVRKVDATP